MALVVISIDRESLPEHTDEQFEAWVRFCVGDRGGCGVDNPMGQMDLEAEVREVG